MPDLPTGRSPFSSPALMLSGGRGLEVAEVVGSGDGIEAAAVLDLLTGLVEKSLVIYEEVPGGETTGATPRYRLLETVRQYARDRLVESSEGEAVRRRHQGHFLQFAERAAPELEGTEQVLWLDRMETEHDNLRAAIAWCEPPETDATVGLRMAVALGPFWDTRGYRAEGLETLQQALSPGSAVPTALRTSALARAGSLALRLGDYQEAERLLQGMLALAEASGDREALARALFHEGSLAAYRSHLREGEKRLEESVILWRELENPRGLAGAIHNLGYFRCDLGDYRRARACLDEALALNRELGHKRGVAMALAMLGRVARREGAYRTARTRLEESLALYREVGDQGGIAHASHDMGLIYYAKGEHTAATTWLENSVAGWREIGQRNYLAGSLVALGQTYLTRGDRERARTVGLESLSILASIRDLSRLASCLGLFAALAVTREQAERAAHLCGAADAVREKIQLPVLPEERPDLDRTIDTSRSLLGEASYTVAWEKGKAMTVDQIVAYVRGEPNG